MAASAKQVALYGGALGVALPASFVDVSQLRQVPDHQEVWLAPQPILFFVYMQQYARGLYFALSPTLGRQRVQGWHAGVKGYGSLSLTGALGGGGGSAGAKAE
jgi:hypothetical protein